MATFTLFGLEISVYTRIVRLTLEECGFEYDFSEVDIFADSGPPADYWDKHPFGRIPCLQHGNLTLYETSAICRYINDISVNSTLQPSNIIERARMNQIIGMLDSYTYQPMVWDVFVQRISIPEEGGIGDEQVIADALNDIVVVLDQLEVSISVRNFLVGNFLSLADLHAFPMLLYFEFTPDGKAMLENYPRIFQWLSQLKLRDSVIKTQSLYG